MSKKLLNIIMLLFISLIVSACGEEPCKRQCDKNGEHCRRDCGEGELECVAADDWGDPKIWVPAGGTNLKGDYDNGQISAPVDSGQVLLDSKKFPLVISVGKRNQWTSWFGGEGINPKGSDGKPDPYGWDNGRIVPNIECQYTVTNGSSPGDIKDDLSPATIWQEIKNPDNLFYMGRDNNYYMVKDGSYHNGEPLYANSKTPCNFRYGMGLYVGLAPDNGVGGKATSDNVILTYHIPDAKSPDVVNNQNIYFDPMTGTAKPVPTCDPDKTYTEQDNKACFDYRSASAKGSPSSMTSNANNKERGMDGYLVRGFATNELPGAQTGDRLYFKIVDSFYEDNEGGYLVRIREGTRSPAGGPLETVTGVLLEPVKVIMERIYKGIIDNQTFVQLVRAMLALYIVFYGFKFMMGMSGPEELRKDAVMRMLKIGVIVQVISPDSWAFFYSHLFGMFIDGVMQIASLLMSPFADYDPMQPWYSMDRLLAKFFSAETNAKIASTLLSNLPLGPFIIIVLYGSMILFLRALIKAVIIYIVGFIAIAILIAIAPIFIIFMLFEKTKELLEEWWGQLVAFAIQEILLMASLGMFAAVIVWFMEHTIGYTVCWNVWADFDFIGINMSGPKSAWYNGNLF
ncbi:MAG: TrbL/VirB6 plasmid conjugal transfer protein, partial [Rickettsiaceae bacterium]|nr:TrbL/VirB6 plasmid conjugal transfer protein [Rickettsiaceae bacterium]